MDNQAVEDYMKQKARQEGKLEGIRIGEEKGKIKGKIEIAKTMLLKGYSMEYVTLITGLYKSDIQSNI